jgi:hypothetical protein
MSLARALPLPFDASPIGLRQRLGTVSESVGARQFQGISPGNGRLCALDVADLRAAPRAAASLLCEGRDSGLSSGRSRELITAARCTRQTQVSVQRADCPPCIRP